MSATIEYMDEPLIDPRTTTMRMAESDYEMLRELAFRRAKLKGGRMSQSAVLRDLIKRESERVAKLEAARA